VVDFAVAPSYKPAITGMNVGIVTAPARAADRIEWS
jgi:hypothetical protein